MSSPVFITATAEKDLGDLVAYIEESDGPDQAKVVLDRLLERIFSLESLPGRGNVVPEMLALGHDFWRDLHEPPWRIIYQEWQGRVYVSGIFDSRRDLRDLLQERLLRP